MGSRAEFFEAVKFIEKHKIHPVVDTVLDTLEKAEDGYQLMKRGGQFGKVRKQSQKAVPCRKAAIRLTRAGPFQIIIAVEREQKRKL